MPETNFLLNYGEEVAILLFGIGFANLLIQKNLIKKIIGLNIMDTAVYLFGWTHRTAAAESTPHARANCGHTRPRMCHGRSR